MKAVAKFLATPYWRHIPSPGHYRYTESACLTATAKQPTSPGLQITGSLLLSKLSWELNLPVKLSCVAPCFSSQIKII